MLIESRYRSAGPSPSLFENLVPPQATSCFGTTGFWSGGNRCSWVTRSYHLGRCFVSTCDVSIDVLHIYCVWTHPFRIINYQGSPRCCKSRSLSVIHQQPWCNRGSGGGWLFPNCLLMLSKKHFPTASDFIHASGLDLSEVWVLCSPVVLVDFPWVLMLESILRKTCRNVTGSS